MYCPKINIIKKYIILSNKEEEKTFVYGFSVMETQNCSYGIVLGSQPWGTKNFVENPLKNYVAVNFLKLAFILSKLKCVIQISKE